MIAEEKELISIYKDFASHTPFIGVKDRDITYIVSTSDYSGGLKLFLKREHLASQIPIIFDWCKNNLDSWPHSNRILLNAGAYIGTAVIPSVRYEYFSSVIAFEPDPLNAKLLRANLALNDVQHIVTVYELALSDQNIIRGMYLSKHNHGAHAIFSRESRLESHALNRGEKDWAEIKVECQRFDDFANDHGIQIEDIGLVFMDIEGYEGHFLEGAQDLLRQRIPIITEVFSYFLYRAGGMGKFVSNALKYFSKFTDCSFPGKEAFKVYDIDDLKAWIDRGNLCNIILIP